MNIQIELYLNFGLIHFITLLAYILMRYLLLTIPPFFKILNILQNIQNCVIELKRKIIYVKLKKIEIKKRQTNILYIYHKNLFTHKKNIDMFKRQFINTSFVS